MAIVLLAIAIMHIVQALLQFVFGIYDLYRIWSIMRFLRKYVHKIYELIHYVANIARNHNIVLIEISTPVLKHNLY